MRSRIGWGVGTVIALLLTAAVYSFGVLKGLDAVGLFLLLEGLWTVACGLLFVEVKDRGYYTGWGVVLALLSLFPYIPAGYTIGLVLVAVVILIVVFTYAGKTRSTAAAAQPQSMQKP